MDQFNNLTSNVPNVQTFNSGSPTTTTWQPWTKPNDAMLIHILCIGGGGGGGGGSRYSITTIPHCGGAGGGSGAVTSMYIPAFLLPDTLYVQVGFRGAGGAGATVNNSNGGGGGTGGTSYVALYPNSTLIGNLLLYANGGGGGGGGNTNGGTGSLFGSAGTAAVNSAALYLALGQFTSTAGQNGGNYSSNVGQSITISSITNGGATGGGSQNNGTTLVVAGDINSPSALIPYLTSLAGGVGNGTSVNIAGKNGYNVKKPLIYVSGSGGGASTSSVTGASGNGGNGAIGCGGGGGGGASGTSPAGGAGGRGGDGIVIITSYSI